MAFLHFNGFDGLTLESGEITERMFTKRPRPGYGKLPEEYRERIDYVRRGRISHYGDIHNCYLLHYADGWVSPVGDHYTLTDAISQLYDDVRDSIPERNFYS